MRLDKYTQFSECRDAVNKTIQWFYLLHRLRKEGYLTLIQAKNQGLSVLGTNQNMEVSQPNANTLLFANGETIDNTFQWKDKDGNKLYEPFNLGDLDSIDIREYITSVPIISQDLFDLIEHNFISEDIRLLKKELRLAQASFAIAIAAFIVALLTYLLPVECNRLCLFLLVYWLLKYYLIGNLYIINKQ